MSNFPATGNYNTDAGAQASAQALADDLDGQLLATLELPGAKAPTELTIASATITVPTGNGCQHTVDTEADAASDDLETIVQTNTRDGAWLLLSAANAARTVVVQHGAGGSGQILLADDADFRLDDTDKFLLLRRDSTSWVEITRSYGADRLGARAFAFVPKVISPSVLCPHEDLAGSRPTAATVTFTADALLLEDATGNQHRIESFNQTANIGTSGIGGLATGTEANSTWYYVWAIAKADGTQNLVLAPSSSLATVLGYSALSSNDYVRAGLIGVVYNGSGGDLLSFSQRGLRVSLATPEAAVAAGTATTSTSVDLSAIVPPEANTVRLQLQAERTGANSNATITLRAASSGHIVAQAAGIALDTGDIVQATATVPLLTDQTLWYQMSAATIEGDINVYGWEY